eukprot:scaffold5137_cov67-Phaeocystis_antarctica.AAC.2
MAWPLLSRFHLRSRLARPAETPSASSNSSASSSPSAQSARLSSLSASQLGSAQASSSEPPAKWLDDTSRAVRVALCGSTAARRAHARLSTLHPATVSERRLEAAGSALASALVASPFMSTLAVSVRERRPEVPAASAAASEAAPVAVTRFPVRLRSNSEDLPSTRPSAAHVPSAAPVKASERLWMGVVGSIDTSAAAPTSRIGL